MSVRTIVDSNGYLETVRREISDQQVIKYSCRQLLGLIGYQQSINCQESTMSLPSSQQFTTHQQWYADTQRHTQTDKHRHTVLKSQLDLSCSRHGWTTCS